MARKKSTAVVKDADAEQRHEDQLNGSSGKGGIRSYLAHRAKPYAPPVVGVAAVGALSVPGWLYFDGSAQGAAILTLGSVATTAAAWWTGDGAHPARRLHTVITTAAGSAWLSAACICGPLTGVLPDLYAVGGPTVAMSWILRMIMRRNPEGTAAQAADNLLERVGLAKAKLGEAKVSPNRVEVAYALPAGEATNKDMSNALPMLESGLDLRPGAVRMVADPDSARRGTLVIVPEDQLSEPTRWAGPSDPGGTIANPLHVGVYDDGAPLLLTLREAIHILIMGMTGSGKTEGALIALCEILTRRDVVVWLSDAAKAGQDFMPLLPALDWAALDMPSTLAMVEAIKAAIPARTRWLGQHKYRAWEPACANRQTSADHSCRPDGKACGCEGMPYLVGWMEEAAAIMRVLGDEVFTGIAQEARAAGITLVISLQRASSTQMSTDTRASLPGSWCFGVKTDVDATFALGHDVLDAGANPAAWKNLRKGYCYLAAGGTDEDRHANPARTFWSGPGPESAKVLAWVAYEFAGVRADIDPVTAGAAMAMAGDLYADRKEGAMNPAPAMTDEEVMEMADEAEAVGEMVALVDPEDMDADATAPIQFQGPAIQFGAARDKVSTEAAREALREAIETLAAAQNTVGPKDLAPFLAVIARDRSWVSRELKALADGGTLARTSEEGRYRILSALVPA